MTQDTHLSTLSLAILGLIAQKPQSGYDIRKVFSTTPMGHFSSSPGAIYPALRRIEAGGWIGTAGRSPTSGRHRRTYEITRAGMAALKRHLSQPVTQDDVIWHLDDLMLRFALMDPILGREATLRFLREYAAEIDRYLAGQHHSAQQNTEYDLFAFYIINSKSKGRQYSSNKCACNHHTGDKDRIEQIAQEIKVAESFYIILPLKDFRH